MATLRAVRNRIVSVGKIKKITRAQEIVALTRLRRMERTTLASRDYFQTIRGLLFDVAQNINFQSHPFLKKPRSIKTVGIVVIFSDKGLCGNFNANVNSKFKAFVSNFKNKKIKVVIIGKKGVRYLKQTSALEVLGAHPAQDKETPDKGVFDIAGLLSESFLSGKIDKIFLLYNKFRRHLLGEVNILPLLPFVLEEEQAKKSRPYQRNYIYEPNPYEIFEGLVREYIANQIQQGLVESRSAEEISRMLAMKSAGENADEMITKLKIAYHKTRQAQITRELSEVIAAAEVTA